MNKEMLKRMKEDKGFIAALDQSGGSTPKALLNYGIDKDAYGNDEEMFSIVHQMRTRIIKSPSFTGEKIIGAILFEVTMDSKIDDKYTADFLWEEKKIVPFLKVDLGLADEKDGVRLMKDITDLDEKIARAKERNVFGTKMRSVINDLNEEGIKAVVRQQFEYAKRIADGGLVPIVEPEITISMDKKAEAEDLLKAALIEELKNWGDQPLMFKLTLPEKANLYECLYDNPAVIRVVALSGGYSREESNKRLAENNRVVASFSRALTEGLKAQMGEFEFDKLLEESVDSIYQASCK
ncbi:fructose bisphosphate aldolase [uncultured Ezakiella sp.]|uniref:fructose bisphosphate aldolase n=1 Tax=uncultured Ezakiella sp. TaxID=1637529 RepID=UPI0025FC5035|nr:fructose bisphosphate aldolase [uncultured Ezakiella sp.]